MAGERKPQYANDFNKSDILQLLFALQNRVNRDLHVASICVIESKISEYAYRCSCFPKQKDKDAAVINAICIRNADRKIIDAALNDEKKLFAICLMMDSEFDANYEYILSKGSYEAINVDSTLHSLNNAAIIYLGDAIDGTTIEEIMEE